MSFLRRAPLQLAKARCTRAYCSEIKLSQNRAGIALARPRLDYKAICDNVISKTNNAINRKASVDLHSMQTIVRDYNELNSAKRTLNSEKHLRAVLGDKIQESTQEKDFATRDASISEASEVKKRIAVLEDKVAALEESLLEFALQIPNDTHPNAPLGPESAAVTLSTHGPELLPADSKRHHVEIGRKLNLFNLESGATVSGSSWAYFINEAALLEVALTNYAFSVAIRHGFSPVMTPDVVRKSFAERCGFNPRDEGDPPVSQMYHVRPNASPSSTPSELVLTATAEIPIAGMFANDIYAGSLPHKVVGYGHAFRAEAGASGADNRGIYRLHQFSKVELFAVTEGQESEAMMESMLQLQISILEGLGFPFRVLDMPTEELGASAYRKYDIEAWMPGRGKWGEVTSLSNCTDFQARRLHIRYRPRFPLQADRGDRIHYAHTLNGTAAAIPRLIIALLENGARFDAAGEVVGVCLPEILRPFWLGQQSSIISWGLP
ncbi:seryl-tRNA synthetase [Fistulina hepatica ATCC 64428]|uniref:serine--tRNA ligase n=1 Tax=Fistulina hepatica ATCC 64428 TaxID=1128425 RepID=A0A0D7AHM8_9AGAR|nr:seryl-tRNA synthetase [Fistulina hepatica ATCC 64428]